VEREVEGVRGGTGADELVLGELGALDEGDPFGLEERL